MGSRSVSIAGGAYTDAPGLEEKAKKLGCDQELSKKRQNEAFIHVWSPSDPYNPKY